MKKKNGKSELQTKKDTKLWTNIPTEFGELESPDRHWKRLQLFEMPDFI